MFPAKPFPPTYPLSAECKLHAAQTSTAIRTRAVHWMMRSWSGSTQISSYKYFTYYGGSNVDDAFAITADASGNAFVTGTTASTDLLTQEQPFRAHSLALKTRFSWS